MSQGRVEYTNLRILGGPCCLIRSEKKPWQGRAQEARREVKDEGASLELDGYDIASHLSKIPANLSIIELMKV
jgi:hypothetical protein